MALTPIFLSRRRAWSILALYAVLSTAFCWPIFAQPLANGHGDWDQHVFYYASVLRNAAYGDLPFWNPWYCGGDVMWANPQVSLVSPIYLLALVMPVTLAMKLNVVAHVIAGCVGMHLLVRRIVGVRSLAVTVYLVSLFAFSGAMAFHLRAGHTNYLSVFLAPLIVFCFSRAAEGRTRFLVFGAALVAWTILNAGIHTLPLSAVMLGALGLGALVFGRAVRPLGLAIAMVVIGCVYAAPRIVPAMLFVKSPDFRDTRPVKGADYMSPEMLGIALFDGSQDTTVKVSPGVQLYGWHEYGNYMGWFGAPLILASAAWILIFRRRRDEWREGAAALSLVVVFLLAAGEFAALAPASLLKDLPLLSNFRIPSRYMMLLPLPGALCAAFALRALETALGVTLWRRAVELLCVVGLLQIVIVNRQHLRDVFILDAHTQSQLFVRMTPSVAELEAVTPGGPRVHRTFLLDSMLAGVSPLNCYEPLQANKVARPGPMTIVGDAGVTITEPAFSPNRVSARALVGTDPGRVVLNQNFVNGWSSPAGQVEHDPVSGRPSVVLPAGYSGTVEFRYVPPGFWIGLAIGLAGLVASLLAVAR